MIEIPLENLPNQVFSILLDDARFEFRINTLDNGACVVSIARDGVDLIRSVRTLPFRPLLPYGALEGDTGNFLFETSGGDYPTYTEFGLTQRLIYASAAELGEIRNGG
ncbi:MAG: hypothetical protein LBJ76_04060 [Candidatus Accumulibacter sp.]|jgi:hypothetical protein|nr:hypothetical protein [Accumulibacter sp.]